jgi:hypothetical protein
MGKGRLRDSSRCESERRWPGALETFCRRAAFLAGAVESHAGAGLDLWLDGGMAYDASKDQGCSVKGEVAVPDLSDRCWEGGAGSGNCRSSDAWDGGPGLPHYPHAVMCASPSAAGRKIRVRAGHQGQNGRDQREAEEKKQDDAEDASHKVIVSELRRSVCQRPVICIWADLN